VSGISPGTKIRALHGAGRKASSTETLNAVRVIAPSNGGHADAWTYYRNRDACEAVVAELKREPSAAQ
jgi:hypothetical protein